MDAKLTKLFNEFCELKDELNTSNVTEKTVDIIGRFGKAVKSAESIVLDPPKRDTSFDPELHLKSSTYKTLKESELEDWKKPKVVKEPVKKAPQKRGPKPKK